MRNLSSATYIPSLSAGTALQSFSAAVVVPLTHTISMAISMIAMRLAVRWRERELSALL